MPPEHPYGHHAAPAHQPWPPPTRGRPSWGLAITLYCVLFLPVAFVSVMLVLFSGLTGLLGVFAHADEQSVGAFYYVTAVVLFGAAFLVLMLPGTAAAWAVTRRFRRGVLHGLWTVIPTTGAVLVVSLLLFALMSVINH
ncbi:hypothetical protein [Nesterenkonia marinintestina]|uniref:hypothetical protein n=1 Tax=Nesterenkonia marinintestina TaxID=2979865 RepID=UPI0021C0359F|nr:hypothetical protein [Nesterenkonia sp. GX14115]